MVIEVDRVTTPVRTAGRYALFDEIASGGMATVHVARLVEALGFSRTVAVKRLHPQFAKDPQFVAMFLDEARLAARIRHPNVVPTLDVVSTEDELFLVMEYVAGMTLSRLTALLHARAESIPPRVTCAIMVGVLHGLHAAHEATSDQGEPLHLIHRDVTPQNILVGVDGIARLLDFGVAKAAGQIHTTRDGQLKGKLAYMPPEQLYGRKLDRRTDIYAAGIVLWETLVGKRLFAGESDGATVTKILATPVDAPSVAKRDCTDAFDSCVMVAIDRAPEKRFATAKELALAIETAAGPGGVATTHEVGEWVLGVAGDEIHRRAARIAEIERSGTSVARAALPTVPEKDVSSVSVSQDDVPTARSRRTAALAVGLLAMAALGFAFLYGGRGHAIESPATSSQPPAIASVEPPPSTISPAAPPATGQPPASATSVQASSVAAPPSRPTHHPAPAASSCNPPFTYEGGIKTYKPWCYVK